MHKKFIAAAAMLIMACTAAVYGANNDNAAPRRYVDASQLRIINAGYPADSLERPYARVPRWVRDSIAPGRELWDRQQCSSGLGVRFATNSRQIGVRYDLHWDTHMIHMADTGLKGTDLYIWEGDSAWRHVNTNRPYVKKDSTGAKTRHVESTYVSNLDGETHQYIIYMPLYDGVEAGFSVAIDSGAVIDAGRADLIDPARRIVAYGTSILQGGCASRAGMAATNIIGRELNAEVVNLGFSGEGKMDSYMARALAQIPDVDVYLLDPVPNCTEMMCDTLTVPFVSLLHELRPEVPIVMLEGPIYPYARYDSYFNQYLPKKNAAYHRGYEAVRAKYPDANITYVTSEGLDGAEDDGTVDGIHLTDLGFRHYADRLRPVLQKVLDGQP